MSRDKDFYEYIKTDVLNEIDGIISRAMFGGYGFYRDGIFFALISDGKLYFKVGPNNRNEYEKYGSKPFVYTGHKGKSVTMSYWELPADILEDKGQLAEWVEKAVEAKNEEKKNSS
ncbi:MAG: TfoX/Sxy family protein [Candidatus Roizmanbacteria bacterium]|nr:TfoX/Sxy family protein [Candidatus Roizmanbacteria bacterium]